MFDIYQKIFGQIADLTNCSCCLTYLTMYLINRRAVQSITVRRPRCTVTVILIMDEGKLAEKQTKQVNKETKWTFYHNLNIFSQQTCQGGF